jgi:hypothetical protein
MPASVPRSMLLPRISISAWTPPATNTAATEHGGEYCDAHFHGFLQRLFAARRAACNRQNAGAASAFRTNTDCWERFCAAGSSSFLRGSSRTSHCLPLNRTQYSCPSVQACYLAPISCFCRPNTKALDRRPKLAAAIKAARKIKGPVIIAKLDRLSRDVSFISNLMVHKVPFTSLLSPL